MRRKVSAFILWCALAALYLGGVFLLIVGLVLSSEAWWRVIQLNAGSWEVGAKTAELLILAAGFVLVLVIPFLQRHAYERSGLWRAERRSELKRRVSVANQR